MLKIKSILFLLLIPSIIVGQNLDSLFKNRGEIQFSFKYTNKQQVDELSKIISIDHKTNNEKVYAYANKKSFIRFLKKDINYNLIEHKPLKFNNEKNNWNYYPSYLEYIEMMQSFADSFPDICKIHSIGTLSSGREILIAQISDNVGQKENEPSFLYTSSMHGDELAGYVLMLRLIDKLLSEYNTNNRIKNLINEIDIWINPLANPDGAYAGGNQNVWYATRFNANLIDLNRNYPDPQDGQNPDGNSWQDETKFFMGLADTVDFTMSANIHGGVEVCNYPWDTWGNLAADDNWWQYISTEYADSCQANSSNGYFDYLNDGITNGYDWYEVNGGRQDYMNYFRYCREVTLELSNEKTPNPQNLPTLWNANYPSFINYMQQSLYGIRGIVADSITGNPLRAKIEIVNIDNDSSHIYSSLPVGNYHRYLFQGNYNITFSKAGYYQKIVNATILNNNTTVKNVYLVPITTTNIQDIELNNEKNVYFDILGRNNRSNNSIQISKKEKKIILE